MRRQSSTRKTSILQKQRRRRPWPQRRNTVEYGMMSAFNNSVRRAHYVMNGSGVYVPDAQPERTSSEGDINFVVYGARRLPPAIVCTSGEMAGTTVNATRCMQGRYKTISIAMLRSTGLWMLSSIRMVILPLSSHSSSDHNPEEGCASHPSYS